MVSVWIFSSGSPSLASCETAALVCNSYQVHSGDCQYHRLCILSICEQRDHAVHRPYTARFRWRPARKLTVQSQTRTRWQNRRGWDCEWWTVPIVVRAWRLDELKRAHRPRNSEQAWRTRCRRMGSHPTTNCSSSIPNGAPHAQGLLTVCSEATMLQERKLEDDDACSIMCPYLRKIPEVASNFRK